MSAERSVALHPLAGLQPVEVPDDELQAVIRAHAAELAAREAGTRSGADPEDLHKFRVATRRIRSLLRSTRGQLADPAAAERLRAELSWLASLLGEVRDRDVLIEYLLGELETLDGAPFGAILELLDEEREEARRELVASLDSTRYKALHASLERPPALREGETLAAAAKAEYTRLRKAMRKLGEGATDEELHEARIRGKRTRYAAEAAQTDKRFVERAKELQDALGEHQDAVVAERRVRELLEQVRGTGRTAFAAGRLVERQRARREEARRLWPVAWRRLEKAGAKAFS
jgi:CHAD domain-containing protein